MQEQLRRRVEPRLRLLYGEQADACWERLWSRVERFAATVPSRGRMAPSRGRMAGDGSAGWDESDIVLIAYGDQLQSSGKAPLAALRDFLRSEELEPVLKMVHLLPFFPFSSDDGFAVVDYLAVDERLGDWADIANLAQGVDLIFDFVMNHASSESAWFRGFLQGDERFKRHFVEMDPATDLSQVTRPRNSPLLTEFSSPQGPRHVWTTFSADQVDLNFAEPAVLVRMVDVLLKYIEKGARCVRLDAVGFLWKKIGTSSMHLRETHEIIKLMRDVVDVAAPHVLLLTETNVPHEENISYFGDGDEAHMVYQFSLPPLLLEALLSQDATALRRWLAELTTPPAGATYFNFTASHDGIGVRPLEGLIPHDRVLRLAEETTKRGGYVSYRSRPDGSESPYELNITYFDALRDPEATDDALDVRRFLCAQAIMLSLRGMPAVYFHSLVGSPNDREGAEQSGIPRRINRKKYDLDELRSALHGSGVQQQVFEGMKTLLAKRVAQKAFHPDGDQTVIPVTEPAALVFVRTSPDQTQRIIVAANLGASAVTLNLATGLGDAGLECGTRTDVLSGASAPAEKVALDPYQVAWLG